jgi:hypothetical protein
MGLPLHPHGDTSSALWTKKNENLIANVFRSSDLIKL